MDVEQGVLDCIALTWQKDVKVDVIHLKKKRSSAGACPEEGHVWYMAATNDVLMRYRLQLMQ